MEQLFGVREAVWKLYLCCEEDESVMIWCFKHQTGKSRIRQKTHFSRGCLTAASRLTLYLALTTKDTTSQDQDGHNSRPPGGARHQHLVAPRHEGLWVIVR